MNVRPELTKEQRGLLEKVLIELKKVKIPGTTTRPKKSTGYSRSVAFGFIRKRALIPGPSRYNLLKPNLWNALKTFANSTKFEWDSIQVNQNCVCNKHKDRNNTGDSYLVSLGDYTGGELVIEGTSYDCNMKPIIFNGAELEHWNNEFTGNKWSVILFKTSIPNNFKKDFPENWRDCEEYIKMKS